MGKCVKGLNSEGIVLTSLMKRSGLCGLKSLTFHYSVSDSPAQLERSVGTFKSDSEYLVPGTTYL